MGRLNISGIQTFFLTENDRFPVPDHHSIIMFAIRENEERQHWLYAWHSQRCPLVSETPFKTQGFAIEAALAFDLSNLIKKNARK